MFFGVILYIISFIAGFFLTSIFVRNIVNFISIEGVTLTATSPFQYIQVSMDFGFFLATIITIPYAIYSLYVFVLPALTQSERTKLLKSIPVSAVLFVSGFFYGFAILYYALEFLAAINTSLGVSNFWDISQFLSQILTTAAMLGFIFQFPLLLTLSIMLGIVTTATLRSNRRIAYAILLFFSILLPPTDILSLFGIVLPLLLLYEATIALNDREKRQGR